jgi:phosphatidylinositol-3-phosphatase
MSSMKAFWLAAGLALVVAGAATASVAQDRPPRFAHVVVVVFENRSAPQILGNPNAPVLNRLARRYALLSNYYAVAHPSLPNYIALISGTTRGFSHDCVECLTRAPTLADTLRAAHMTWKTYVEGVRRERFASISSTTVKARIPFLYAGDVIAHDAQLDRIVPLAQFGRDLRARRLPSYSLVVPSLCHDMHNCSVGRGDRWFGGFVRPLLARLGPRDVLFVVFDEGRRRDRRGGGGRVLAIAAGPLVRRGVVSRRGLDHYSLLRTIEDAWHLPLLGRSAAAAAITGIWRVRSRR